MVMKETIGHGGDDPQVQIEIVGTEIENEEGRSQNLQKGMKCHNKMELC